MYYSNFKSSVNINKLRTDFVLLKYSHSKLPSLLIIIFPPGGADDVRDDWLEDEKPPDGTTQNQKDKKVRSFDFVEYLEPDATTNKTCLFELAHFYHY